MRSGKLLVVGLVLAGGAATLGSACGGKVVFDGAPGAGGAGGAGQTTVGPGTTTTNDTVGVTTVAVGPGPTSSVSVVTSTSSGPSDCDNTGDCGFCQQCALEGPCAADWDACLSNIDCAALIDCITQCTDDGCYEKCQDTYQAGIDLYMTVATCVVCDACFADCGGGQSGC